jgi:hypothetical protein
MFAHAGALGVMLSRLGRSAARSWLAKSRPGARAAGAEADPVLAALLR